MDDLVNEFIDETNESLEELDVDLVTLEQNPNDNDLLSKIFRLVHTIKGTCGFLGLPRLEKVAHHAENVLGRFRDGDLEVTPAYVTLIFESIDQIKFIVGAIEETGAEPEGDDADLIRRLDEVFEGKAGGGGEAAAPEPEAPKAAEPVGDMGSPQHADLDELERAFQEAPGPEDMAAQDNAESAEEDAAAADTVDEAAAPTPPPAPEPEKPAAAAAPAGGKKEGAVSNQTLRVNVDVLENLMTMVSEMVLTRNQLLQILRTQTESEFSGPLQRLNHVVSELQEGVMKTRMQPIGNAWAKLPRIIRDLSLELGKKIDLEMRGQDTELDRQVLELIKDPLTHMVRNSGDHGIETPDVRKAAGKPEIGKILLNAYHEGGHIIIEITDDGKGLAADKIKAKVIEKGLASEEELADMSTQQINQFIFKAGFSTAEKVTSVSGRGVGMDVVRTNIEKIGGSIELKSIEGKGSTFLIKIPLTLAIVSALIVESAGERFAIPQLSVRELVMTSVHGDSQIEMIKDTPVFRLRDRLLPLVPLAELLKLQSVSVEEPVSTLVSPLSEQDDQDGEIENFVDAEHESSGIAVDPQALRRNQYIIVTQVGTQSFGIVVDRVYDTEEIVVKPVASILKDIELFSGNTILGDGSVIMILDPNGIAKAVGETDSTDMSDSAVMEEGVLSKGRQKTSLLLFDVGDDAPKAVPLALVARLENIDLADVEHSGGQMMIQYREQLMPLSPFRADDVLEKTGERPVLVFADSDKSMGLVVEKIIDIVEEHIDVQIQSNQRSGIIGSAIISGKATDVVDVAHFLGRAHDDWYKDHGDEPYKKANGHDGGGRHKVLLVDDSPFFRNMISPVLSVAGYDVTSLESPVEALSLCERGAKFDVIISDIEMPDMDGFEFAEKVRTGDGGWKNTPMVALSSHATPQDMEKGKAVGFTQYVAKFDRDTLLTTLSKTILNQDNYKENVA